MSFARRAYAALLTMLADESGVASSHPTAAEIDTRGSSQLSIRACSVVASTIFSIRVSVHLEIEKASFQFRLSVGSVDGSNGVI